MSDVTLKEAFPSWYLGEGIFEKIYEQMEVPWDSSLVDSNTLDLEYFGNYSGSRLCAPLVKFLLNSEEHLTDAGREILAKIIATKYAIPWKHLWDTYEIEYNPIHNYNMTEERELVREGSEEEERGGTEHHTGTDTFQHGKTETTNHGMTTTSLTSKFGFNSPDDAPKPSDRVNYNEGGNTAVVDSGSDVTTKNLTDTNSEDSSRSSALEEGETIHRMGNIGVTTTQRMIEDERRVWEWNFFDKIFRDINKVLTLPIMDPCQV